MIGLDYVVAGYLELASAKNLCSSNREPKVMVDVRESPVRYDFSQSQKSLNGMDRDTVSPYSREEKAQVGGLTKGEVQISQNIRFYQEEYSRQARSCLYVDRVNVSVSLKPVIYIADKFPKGSCMFNSIMEHEQKHVETDRLIIAKYRTKIEAEVQRVLGEVAVMGQSAFPSAQLKAKQKDVQMRLQSIVTTYSKELSAERRERQQAIDTRSEYDRVQAVCE